MKKFPFQFAVNSTSLAGVLLFVYWTSHGGLKKDIVGLFGKGASSNNPNDQVEHVGDLLYYYAIISTVFTVIVAALKLIPTKLWPQLHNVLPTVPRVLDLMLELVQQLVIFAGLYVYLLHQDGCKCTAIVVGLKNSQIILFPFWFLVTIALHIVGKALSAITPKQLHFQSASLYLRIATIGLLLAQIVGYSPFKLF